MPKSENPFAGFGESNFAPFVTSAQKRALAMKGTPFTLAEVEKRKIKGREQWCADIILDGEVQCLTFTPSPSRDEAFNIIAKHIDEHGAIKNVALTVVGKNTKTKSASYIFCMRADWRKPKELPAQRSK